MLRSIVLSLALVPSLAHATGLTIALPKPSPGAFTCLGGNRLTASDGTALCSIEDGNGGRTVTGKDASGVARKAVATRYTGPTSGRFEVKYYANDALQLTVTHLLLGKQNDQFAITDPSSFSARVQLLATSAYFYETDDTAQRYGEVYGKLDPNATGDDKFPPHFWDEFRANWAPVLENVSGYFGTAIDAPFTPYNDLACAGLSAIAADLACGGLMKNFAAAAAGGPGSACRNSITAGLTGLCIWLDANGPTIGGDSSGGGHEPNGPIVDAGQPSGGVQKFEDQCGADKTCH